jgi:predicted GNAT superfamily acetyltransferase
MQIHYNVYSALPPEPVLSKLLDLLTEVFANQSREEWLADLTGKATAYSGFQLLLALDGTMVVGCKVGYQWQPDGNPVAGTFYSWLGGVSGMYRGNGIAGELMRQQHETCRANGYYTIRTHTYNQWREMLILNLRHGFEIVGTQPGKRGLTIVMEKELVGW